MLVLYGRSESIAELDRRRRGRSGDTAHAAAVREQVLVLADDEAEADSRPRRETQQPKPPMERAKPTSRTGRRHPEARGDLRHGVFAAGSPAALTKAGLH